MIDMKKQKPTIKPQVKKSVEQILPFAETMRRIVRVTSQ